MPIEKHSSEARPAKSGPSMLRMLKHPLEPDVLRYSLEQRIEGYRQKMAESNLALTKLRDGRDDLLRQLAEVEAKDRVEPTQA
jgi:hypothetical protein